MFFTPSQSQLTIKWLMVSADRLWQSAPLENQELRTDQRNNSRRVNHVLLCWWNVYTDKICHKLLVRWSGQHLLHHIKSRSADESSYSLSLQTWVRQNDDRRGWLWVVPCHFCHSFNVNKLIFSKLTPYFVYSNVSWVVTSLRIKYSINTVPCVQGKRNKVGIQGYAYITSISSATYSISRSLEHVCNLRSDPGRNIHMYRLVFAFILTTTKWGQCLKMNCILAFARRLSVIIYRIICLYTIKHFTNLALPYRLTREYFVTHPTIPPWLLRSIHGSFSPWWPDTPCMYTYAIGVWL